jgi:hypothetical protein
MIELMRMHMDLHAYANDPNGPDKHKVVRQIRPVLEGYLRMRFPLLLPQDKWLGDFIGAIRAASTGDSLAVMHSHLTELEQLNEFSKRYHHEDGSITTTGLTDTELLPWVRRTISFVEGR